MEAKISFVGLFVLLLMGLGGVVFFALIITMLRDTKTRTIGFVLLMVPLLGGVFLALFMGLFYMKSGVTVHEEVRRAEAEAYQAEEEAMRAHEEMLNGRAEGFADGPDWNVQEIPLDHATEAEGPLDVESPNADETEEPSPEEGTESESDEADADEENTAPEDEQSDPEPDASVEPSEEDAADTFTPVSITPNEPSLEAAAPSWLESPPYAERDVYYWPIKIEPCPTKESCETRLDAEVERVIYLYVSDKQGLGNEIADQARLSPEFIRTRMLDSNEYWFVPVETSFGTWYELYTRVQFDQEADLEIERTIATHRRLERLTLAGIVAAFVFLLLGGIFSYGMASQSTDGRYKWRLRTAFGLGILLLGVAGAFALSMIA